MSANMLSTPLHLLSDTFLAAKDNEEKAKLRADVIGDANEPPVEMPRR